jgi:hypothetical protein
VGEIHGVVAEGKLPYNDIYPVMRAIMALPEAPFTGRARVMDTDLGIG